MKDRIFCFLMLLILVTSASARADLLTSDLPFHEMLRDGYEVTSVCETADQTTAFAVLKKQDRQTLYVLENTDSGFQTLYSNDLAVLQGDYPALLSMTQDGELVLSQMLGRDSGLSCVFAEKNGEWTLQSVESRSGDSVTTVRVKKYSLLITEAVLGIVKSRTEIQGVCDTALRGFSINDFPLSLQEAVSAVRLPDIFPIPRGDDLLPEGVVIAFDDGASYPVYAGPDNSYDLMETVQTSATIRVMGEENEYLFVMYVNDAGQDVYGWITAEALPETITVPAIAFADEDMCVSGETVLLSAPDENSAQIMTLEAQSAVVWLACADENYAYVEVTGETNARGFVPIFVLSQTDALTDRIGFERVDVDTLPAEIDQ